jgi:hypothetical protein
MGLLEVSDAYDRVGTSVGLRCAADRGVEALHDDGDEVIVHRGRALGQA